MNFEVALKEAMQSDGSLGVALVDCISGMCIAVLGGGRFLDLDLAAAGNTEVVRAKQRSVAALGLDQTIDEVLITLTTQYHLICLLSARSGDGLFMYQVLDRATATLGMARHRLKQICGQLSI